METASEPSELELNDPNSFAFAQSVSMCLYPMCANAGKSLGITSSRQTQSIVPTLAHHEMAACFELLFAGKPRAERLLNCPDSLP